MSEIADPEQLMLIMSSQCSLSLCVFNPTVSGGGPSSVSISDETAVSLLVSWVPPNAHVLQYRVSHTALTGGDAQESTVRGPVVDSNEVF